MTENNDFQLIKDFLNGDQSAFNKLAIKYRQKIYWHSRRMLGNHMDADEVTQEVLVVMYSKLHTFKFNSSLNTWIYKITNTRSINQIRKNKVRVFLPIDNNDVMQLKSKNDIAADAENKEKLDQLDSVLSQLPVKQREVFVFRQFEELSYEEISKITGKSIGGLKANYYHALKKVTERMNHEK